MEAAERWREVDRLFAEALERQPGERAEAEALLRQAEPVLRARFGPGFAKVKQARAALDEIARRRGRTETAAK